MTIELPEDGLEKSMTAGLPAVVEQLTTEEKLRRRYWLGGSDIAAVMGVGGYGRTALQVYLQKRGMLPKQISDAWADELDFRKEMEGPIIARLRRKFDYKITAVNVRYKDPEFPFLRAELDFEWEDPETGLIENGEIKTVDQFAFGESKGWGEEWTSEIPIHYEAQVMHGLGVKNRRKCVVVAMSGFRFYFYMVNRDDITIAAMRKKGIIFWTEHVLKGVPPEAVNMDDLLLLHRSSNGTPIEATPEIAEAVRNLRRVRNSRKSMKGDEDDLTFKIAKYLCDAFGATASAITDNAVLTFKETPILTWKKQSMTRLVADAVKDKYPEVAVECSETTTNRVMRLPKQS